MFMYELCRRDVLMNMPDEQRKFASKLVLRHAEKMAKKYNVPLDVAFKYISQGHPYYEGDRWIDKFEPHSDYDDIPFD